MASGFNGSVMAKSWKIIFRLFLVIFTLLLHWDCLVMLSMILTGEFDSVAPRNYQDEKRGFSALSISRSGR